LRPPLFWKELRFTDDIPISARFDPEDERWKRGWFGRGGASDARDPDIDRTWFVVKGALLTPDIEFERFIADAGWGIFEL
jgi:hypothetical protein